MSMCIRAHIGTCANAHEQNVCLCTTILLSFVLALTFFFSRGLAISLLTWVPCVYAWKMCLHMKMDLGVDLRLFGFTEFGHLICWDFIQWKPNQTHGRVSKYRILLKDLCEGVNMCCTCHADQDPSDDQHRVMRVHTHPRKYGRTSMTSVGKLSSLDKSYSLPNSKVSCHSQLIPFDTFSIGGECRVGCRCGYGRGGTVLLVAGRSVGRVAGWSRRLSLSPWCRNAPL